MSELDFEINPEVLENDSFERKPLQPGEYEGEIIGCETKTSARTQIPVCASRG